MTGRSRSRLIAVGACAAVLGAAGTAHAAGLAGVPTPQPKSPGVTSPNLLPRQLAELVVARGSTRLENGTADIPYYGYLGDGPLLPAPGSSQEATKTEPDKNTYLVLQNQTGADPTYSYGTHFLFQGHEGGAGYITRVNLDADGDHRVTLLASNDVNGAALPTFDGSTWDPFAQRLLFTAEHGSSGGVWQATTDVPSAVTDMSGVFGRGGYEGVQNDSLGNVYLVEDVGGVKGTVNSHAKQPNSYLYKFVPTSPADLSQGGRLQVLQVTSQLNRAPILFHDGAADADITSQDVRDLHTYGNTFGTKWVTIHDTAAGTAPFDANALARPVGTPFKRPENGVFKPGGHFMQFFFTETGDTDASTEAGSELGGFGGIFRLTQDAPDADTGVLSLFYRGDLAHTGLDNIAFASGSQLAAVEDAGDTLHSQRNALDSGYQFNLKTSYADPAAQPVRFLAEGRDPSATLDSGFAGTAGFQNEGDNEITGIHISDGDARIEGILGTKTPQGLASNAVWRTFWTAQHGDNVTYTLIKHR